MLSTGLGAGIVRKVLVREIPCTKDIEELVGRIRTEMRTPVVESIIVTLWYVE